MISKSIPIEFNPKYNIVSCFVEFKDKILLLKRSKKESQPFLWGLPAGKLEKNETPINGILRELLEETSINVEKEMIIEIEKLYGKTNEFDYVFHVSKLILNTKPKVILDSNEHTNYIWINPNDAIKKLKLIKDLDEVILYHYPHHNH